MVDEIRIRIARDRADFEACVLLQRAVWGLADLEIISALQLVAAVHAGAILHLAESASGQAMGFGYAFPALNGGVPHYHSDMVAVLPEYQRHGVGIRIKWAQRDEALRRSVALITWTFDPLQARNAHLNLRRLGASAVEFLENFYGITTSSLHHGLPTDRLLVHWNLNAEGVALRVREGEPSRSVAAPASPRINEVKWQAGWPVTSEPRLDLTAEELLLEIPPDWNVLCQAAPRVAEGWQQAMRRAFQSYFAKGYRAVDFLPTEDGGRRRPLYVLRKG
jgi:predicted GNAT superfamily acetyltransferase